MPLRLDSRQPIDADGKPVIQGMQCPRAPRGKPQDARAADPPMCHKQGALRTAGRIVEGDFHRLHRDPRQLLESRVCDLKSEKRGYWRFQGVAQQGGKLPERDCATSPGC